MSQLVNYNYSKHLSSCTTSRLVFLCDMINDYICAVYWFTLCLYVLQWSIIHIYCYWLWTAFLFWFIVIWMNICFVIKVFFFDMFVGYWYCCWLLTFFKYIYSTINMNLCISYDIYTLPLAQTILKCQSQSSKTFYGKLV